VRLISKLAGVSAVAMAVGCGSDAKPTDADLTRDLKAAEGTSLQLANQQAGATYSLTETAPKAKPAPLKLVRRDDAGPAAVPTPAPTVAAAADPVAVSSTVEIPQVQVVEHIELSSTVESVPAVSRPRNTGSGVGDSEAGGDHGGSIFRGGTILVTGRAGGDDDRCLPPVGGTSRQPMGGGIYLPNPGTTTRGPIFPQPTVGVVPVIGRTAGVARRGRGGR
jgi:hypothetical protein